MTNEQLALLIRHHIHMLETVRDEIDERLGKEVERHPDREYIGTCPIPMLDANPENWREVPNGMAVILDPLNELITEFDDQIAMLMPNMCPKLSFRSIPIDTEERREGSCH